MGRVELSERWSAWSDIDGIFCAASAAIDVGPLDPVVCEVDFNEEFDPVAVDTLEQAWEDPHRNPNTLSIDITLSHVDADAARVTLSCGGPAVASERPRQRLGPRQGGIRRHPGRALQPPREHGPEAGDAACRPRRRDAQSAS